LTFPVVGGANKKRTPPGQDDEPRCDEAGVLLRPAWLLLEISLLHAMEIAGQSNEVLPIQSKSGRARLHR
jgi:hypothetical protein